MKGVVMEAHEKKAAVLLKDGTFRVVKGRFSVGDTIEYQEKHFAPIRQWAAAAAVVLLLGTGGGFWYDANLVAYAEVSLDVNPSVIYTVNKRGRVLEARAGNENASATVETLTRRGIRFMPVSEAVEMTIDILSSEGYMDADQEDYVLVNISADEDRMQSRLTGAVEDGLGHAREHDPSMEFRIDHSDRATAHRAAESNMSPGRYAAWEQASDGSSPEAYAEMSVQEIMTGRPGGMTDSAPREPAGPEAGISPSPDNGMPELPLEEHEADGAADPKQFQSVPPFNSTAPSSDPGSGPETGMQDGVQAPSETLPTSKSVSPGMAPETGSPQGLSGNPRQNPPFQQLYPENIGTRNIPGPSMPEK